MQMKKVLIIDRLGVLKVFRTFCISTAYPFAVISPWNVPPSQIVANCLTVFTVFSLYKQNITTQ